MPTLADVFKKKIEKKSKKNSIREGKVLLENSIREKRLLHPKAKKLAKIGIPTEKIRLIYVLLFQKVHRGKAEEALNEIIEYLLYAKEKLTQQ